MNCTAKHTKYQPTEAEFVCPKCGKGPREDGLITDEPAEDSADDCGKLHPNDYLRCFSCDYDIMGQAFALRLAKANSMVMCPCCKGSGLVKKP